MTYRAEAGSVSAGVSLATAGADFSPEEQSVLLGDGEESAVIGVTTFHVCLFMCFLVPLCML